MVEKMNAALEEQEKERAKEATIIQKEILCNQCDEKFRVKDTLQKHKLECHSRKFKNFEP